MVTRRTADANPGWDPTLTSIPDFATQFKYAPLPNEPKTVSGLPFDLVKGYYRWTRAGLRGIDFSGAEVK